MSYLGCNASYLRPKFEDMSFLKSIRERVMSEAVKLIVDAYVTLKDRKSMEELREHRQMLRAKLQAIKVLDVSSSIELIDSDLSEIEAGMSRLQ